MFFLQSRTGRLPSLCLSLSVCKMGAVCSLWAAGRVKRIHAVKYTHVVSVLPASFSLEGGGCTVPKCRGRASGSRTLAPQVLTAVCWCRWRIPDLIP